MRGTSCVVPKVMASMNNSLLVTFTKEEVEMALRQMAPLKYPGPEGFNLGFYEIYWHLLGEEVTSMVLKFLNDGCFDNAINFTYIVLITNKKNPLYASEWNI